VAHRTRRPTANWRETRPPELAGGFRGIDEQVATIVFATLAVSKWIEDRTGWSIKRFVCTTRRYRTIEIQAGNHIITFFPLPRVSLPPKYRFSCQD
jgi:hypothetical protein